MKPRPRKRSADRRRAALGLAAVGLAVGAGAGAVIARRKGASTATLRQLASKPLAVKPLAPVRKVSERLTSRGDTEDAPPRGQPWQCECGQGFLVAGQDRHQIYWLEGADESDPVLSDRCPSCDRPLAAHPRAGVPD